MLRLGVWQRIQDEVRRAGLVIAAERRRAEARVCLDTGEGVVAVTRIVWVLLFQRWKAELSGDPLLRATVHGRWGVFFEGQQAEERDTRRTAVVKVVTAGPCALIWLVGPRVYEQTTSFFFLTCKQTHTTATRMWTRHRNCPSPHHLHSRNCSSCREMVETRSLGLPSFPVARRLLGALVEKRGKHLRPPNERRVSHNLARICR